MRLKNSNLAMILAVLVVISGQMSLKIVDFFPAKVNRTHVNIRPAEAFEQKGVCYG